MYKGYFGPRVIKLRCLEARPEGWSARFVQVEILSYCYWILSKTENYPSIATHNTQALLDIKLEKSLQNSREIITFSAGSLGGLGRADSVSRKLIKASDND